ARRASLGRSAPPQGRAQLEEVTGAAQAPGQPRALLERPSGTQHEVAGVEDPQRLVAHDLEAVLLEVPTPGGRVEQPELADHDPALAVPALNERVEDLPQHLDPGDQRLSGAPGQAGRARPTGQRERLLDAGREGG